MAGANSLNENRRRIVGVDDAGRGPVLGPLVIAGAAFHEAHIDELREMGVRDSKVLSASRREELAVEIKGLALGWRHVELLPSEVDPFVFSRRRLFKLNFLEAKRMADVISPLLPNEVFVDASDVDEERFAEQIQQHLPALVKITSKHHADSTFAVVSAASILAKVHRDLAVAKLRAEYGDFGSGYPSDPKTREFLLRWRRERGDYPGFARRSWKTVKKIDDAVLQTKLF